MKGAISLSGKGLMPPISLPADFTTRIHSYTKIVIPVDLASGPESGRDGGGGRRMEVVDGLCINEK